MVSNLAPGRSNFVRNQYQAIPSMGKKPMVEIENPNQGKRTHIECCTCMQYIMYMSYAY